MDTSGDAWQALYTRERGTVELLLPSIRIAARFNPQQKQQFVESLMSSGRVVGMCGDGGNDCGALRAAHAGMALVSNGSGAEASMVSPFTSEQMSISSVVTLVREGRGALVTSFSCYKFLISQGLTFSGAELVCAYYGLALSYLGLGVPIKLIKYMIVLL